MVSAKRSRAESIYSPQLATLPDGDGFSEDFLRAVEPPTRRGFLGLLGALPFAVSTRVDKPAFDPAHEALRAAARRFIASRAVFHEAEAGFNEVPDDFDAWNAYEAGVYSPATDAYYAAGKAFNGLLRSLCLVAVIVDGTLLVGDVALDNEPIPDPPASCNPRSALLDLDAEGGRS